MNSQEYWAKREAEALKHYITNEKAYEAEIKRIYEKMLDECTAQINAFYATYAAKEGISLAEAKRRVSKADIAAYERKARRYVKEKNFSAKANEEMRLYNTMMKINRLEMLKANIGLALISGSDELDKFMGEILKGRTEEELKRQAGILGKTIKNNAQKVHAIVNGSFHSGTFSDRIWQYQDLMREELGALLQTGLIQGKNPRALTKDLKKYFIGKDGKGGMRYCMERLMRTELARVQTEAQKQSFIRNGFEEYEFIVNGGCCEICEGLKGKHFKVAKMMPGENAPPMHPHCRCSTAAWSDRKEYDEWLDFLDKGGTTEEWNKRKTAGDTLTERRKARLAARQAKPATPDFDTMNRTDLVEWANKNLKTKFEDLSGANIDYIRQAVKVINQFEQKMGGNTIDGLSVKFGGVPSGVAAKYDDKTHTVLLKKTGSIRSFEEGMKNDNARSRHKLKKDYHATETFSGTIWHELGHAIDIDTGQALSKALSASKDLDAKSVKISVYAGNTQNVRVTRRSEAWAENFAAYMDNGGNAKNVPSEIIEMIEGYFEKKINTSLTNNTSKSDKMKVNNDRFKISTQFFASKEKQFGKKVGKHAQDYGLDPSKAEDREKFMRIIGDVKDNAEEIRIGYWRGQKNDVLFHIKGEDVVITDQNNEFITILKGGINSVRVKNARKY